MKRFLSIVILLSMTLHCASRLGVINYLYENRHEIAYEVGLIAEIPMSMCSSDYFEKNGPLIIQEVDTDDSKDSPVQLATAQEITLFSHTPSTIALSTFIASLSNHNTVFFDAAYDQPPVHIFHPPC